MAWEARLEIPIRTEAGRALERHGPHLRAGVRARAGRDRGSAAARSCRSSTGPSSAPRRDELAAGPEHADDRRPGRQRLPEPARAEIRRLRRHGRPRGRDAALRATRPRSLEATSRRRGSPPGRGRGPRCAAAPRSSSCGELAAATSMHAYVLPGDEPDQSVGRFETLTDGPGRPARPGAARRRPQRRRLRRHAELRSGRRTVTTYALDIDRPDGDARRRPAFADLELARRRRRR